MRPLQYQTWETFSVNWHADVKITFTWLREALLKPLPPGSRVVVVSSGAALNGSPASGGYAGSKATQRFIAEYAQDESRRAGLDITVTAVMPRMTPFGDVGRRGVRAYAARSGQTEEAYLKQLGELLTPETAGSALVDLVQADPATTAPGYVLTGAGLRSCHEHPVGWLPGSGGRYHQVRSGELKPFCRTDLVPASRRVFLPLATSRLWDAASMVQEPVLDRWLSAGDPGAVMAAGLPVG